MEQNRERQLILNLVSIVKIAIVFALVFMVALGYLFVGKPNGTKEVIVERVMVADNTSPTTSPLQKDFFAGNFSTNSLGDTPLDNMIKRGHEIVVNTHKTIGPLNGDKTRQFTGNLLTCNNCHLDAGTKAFAAPYIGITGRFPQYRGRENKIGSIEERINGCMQRSMNGKPLPENSEEMRALVAYMNWLGTGVPGGEKFEGQGFKPINIPDRKVNLENGKNVYLNSCASCHGEDALGTANPDGTYSFPPLSGDATYNNGAGMHRVLTAAQFIKYNMPFGATADEPILTDEEAYDVAGYINSLPRPKKANTEKDFPDLKRKPMSTPYGPWDDNFSAEQHKYGPYQEIMAYYEKQYGIKKTK